MAEVLAGWLIASVVTACLIGRWFRYQRDCDDRDTR
jgi:hypothetical protein